MLTGIYILSAGHLSIIAVCIPVLNTCGVKPLERVVSFGEPVHAPL